jgi:hypothetical protein
MKNSITVMSELKELAFLAGASKEKIAAAEQRLGLTFAEDYKAYLEKYGVISARHIELTGIADSKRLNVVDVTLDERRRNPLPQDMYVIENTGIEGVMILQNQSGEIFEWQNKQIKKLFDNLPDYLLSNVSEDQE